MVRTEPSPKTAWKPDAWAEPNVLPRPLNRSVASSWRGVQKTPVGVRVSPQMSESTPRQYPWLSFPAPPAYAVARRCFSPTSMVLDEPSLMVLIWMTNEVPGVLLLRVMMVPLLAEVLVPPLPT